jgi:hypothetical protein
MTATLVAARAGALSAQRITLPAITDFAKAWNVQVSNFRSNATLDMMRLLPGCRWTEMLARSVHSTAPR